MIFIVSTLNAKFDPVKSNLSPEKTLVINQGLNSPKYEGMGFVGIIQEEKLGLSRSRNLGLEYCCAANIPLPWVICDDDVVYSNGLDKKILSLSIGNQLYQGQIALPDGSQFKQYGLAWRVKSDLRSAFQVSSVEMIIADPVLCKSIRFDERFGLGGKYSFGGEEAIFLRDWFKNGGKLVTTDIIIGMHPEVSTGSRTNQMGYWVTRKQLFKEIFSFFWFPLMMLFLIKKSRSVKSLFEAIKGVFKSGI